MGLTWEIQPFWCILEPFHPPSPCTSSASDRKTSFEQVNNRKPQKTNGNEWREGYNSVNLKQHETACAVGGNGKRETVKSVAFFIFFYLVQFHYIWHVVLLFQLMLPLQQCVHTVVTAANLLVVLFLQHGSNAAQAADAASPGAHPAAANSCWGWLGMNRASRYAQGLSCPTDQLFCEQTKALRHVATLDFT